MTTTEILVRGAREHNLCGVDLEIPRGQMICFSGVSGSGKSSLAFDTLYAEGQRRYVESLSNYARQFMGQMPKPDVDLVSGLSPSISISQKSTGKNPRSTVGTVTEIYDFLRVLFARVGTGYCPQCQSEIAAQTREMILGRVMQLPKDALLLILAPLVRGQKGEFRDLFQDLRKQGFAMARVDGRLIALEHPPRLDRQRKHDVEVVVARVQPAANEGDVEPLDERDRGQLDEALEAALKIGDGTLIVHLIDPKTSEEILPQHEVPGEPSAGEDILFSSRYACGQCGTSFPPPSPQLFSFNSPQGMCESCDGLGQLYTFVPELLVPEPKLSFRKGAFPILGKWGDMGRYRRHIYTGAAKAIDRLLGWSDGTMLKTGWEKLPLEARQIWLWGTDESLQFEWKSGRKSTRYSSRFEGIIPELLSRYRTTKNKMQLMQLEKHMDTMPCPDCAGARLNAQASAVRLRSASPDFSQYWQAQGGQVDPVELTTSPVTTKKKKSKQTTSKRTKKGGRQTRVTTSLSLPELCELPIDRLEQFFTDLVLNDTQAYIASEALKEIRTRIGFLLGVGLDYLSLARTAPTLSGGESQRIRLAGQIGSGLVGVLYILDEPSIGLHPRDNERLIATLQRLRDAGNTLIVVEHDEDTMRASDQIVDFGPGPGVKGGMVVASGSVDEVCRNPKSVTGAYLDGRLEIPVPKKLRDTTEGAALQIVGARHNNLKQIDVRIPLASFTCVTGVSGSGKSSLIGDILEPALRRDLNGAESEPGDHDRIEGLEHLDKTIAIDQSPIGRTPRSNPATYVKVFDEIRNLFAQLPEAKKRGYAAGRFSFNVAGGRCAACDGNGSNRLEMDFLADVWVTCPICEGRRYNRETLSVLFKEHSISDVLQLDVSEALQLFENVPKIADKLQTLVDVGLEYLKLGQPSPTLSGGEAQRIKLSRELSKKATGRTLYVLDEPTTGLHFADIQLLLNVLHGLVDRGNTVVVVEHNLDVVKTADWVIDLGPEGGEQGGQIVIAGKPKDVARCLPSQTGKALAPMVGVKRRKSKAEGVKTIREIALPDPKAQTHVVVEGASQHNLKSVDVDLPRNAMTVFCGPSGSGKSSLAMDTIYAEGQRRYVESLSSYARQFIGQMQKPKAERIDGLSPAVALEQKNLGHSPRSTVGTVTEIYDYLRIFMARLGTPHCPGCQVPVGTQTPDQIVDKVLKMKPGQRVLLLAPLDLGVDDDPVQVLQQWQKEGYARVRIDGQTYAMDDLPSLNKRTQYQMQLVVDRLVIAAEEQSRITDSVEQALSVGAGYLSVAIADADREETHWEEVQHSQHRSCQECGRSFPELTPHHFSFNSGVGWCGQCEGLGVQIGTNPSALFRDMKAPLSEGAALLWPDVHRPLSMAMLCSLARQSGIDIDRSFQALDESERRFIFHGTGSRWLEVTAADWKEAKKRIKANKDLAIDDPPLDDQWMNGYSFRFQFKGFYPTLESASRLSASLRGKLESFTAEIDCNSCLGSRLRDDASAVQFNGRTIGDLVRMPLEVFLAEVKGWKLGAAQRRVAGELIRELKHRTQFLVDVGLGYLTLHRGAATLSGGEAQRIRLAAQLGSGLCGVLYVLDEPTIGLHPRDNQKLLSALHSLRDLGNTLLVVEHDRDVIAGSDHLCDFGPRSGRYGGRVVAQGAPDRLEPAGKSLTGAYLDGSQQIEVPRGRRPVRMPRPPKRRSAARKGGKGTGKKNFPSLDRAPAIGPEIEDGMVDWLTVRGAFQNNLQDVDFSIPLGTMTAVTGPSGSGKSTMIGEILYPALARRLHRARTRPGRHRKLEGLQHIDKVIRVDQSPLGNTPSSNIATYTGMFDAIRSRFAHTPDARQKKLTTRHFSFNVPGGRCETCEGTGQLLIEMHFLPDVYMPCDECHGKRFGEEVLGVQLHGRSIADVLEMSCEEAFEFFADVPRIAGVLQTLCDVGLQYVTLGQTAPTLSGGEAQRVKLAAELARPDTGRTLYLLDEPTTGLHFDDIQKLLKVLQRLVDLGNTVVVIEHNLDVIKCADWVIDMGPEAGVEGGQVVVTGTPEEVAGYALSVKPKSKKKSSAEEQLRSYTGEFLAEVL